MTTIKGTLGKSGEVRRYFCCTGKTHKRICTGPGVTVYAEDLEHIRPIRAVGIMLGTAIELRAPLPGKLEHIARYADAVPLVVVVDIKVEDLEHMIDACISGKLADLKAEKILVRREVPRNLRNACHYCRWFYVRIVYHNR